MRRLKRLVDSGIAFQSAPWFERLKSATPANQDLQLADLLHEARREAVDLRLRRPGGLERAADLVVREL